MNALWWKQPSAWLPIVMSLASLGIVLGHFAIYGVVHEADEGTPAHLFQLLMAGQVPVVGYFAITRIPKAPKAALLTLAVQGAAAASAFASVYFLT